jgi:hypothetical protein
MTYDRSQVDDHKLGVAGGCPTFWPESCFLVVIGRWRSHILIVKTDNRKKQHPLFAGQPTHILKLRESAEKQRRLRERREWKANHTEGAQP